MTNIQDSISGACVCKLCRRKTLDFTVESVGVASIPIIVCSHCGRETHSSPAKTTFGRLFENRRCLTDYAVNFLYVLGFLTVGDGSWEAQRILGLLDLLNLTTMEKQTFTKVENKVSSFIVRIAEDTMKRNLIAGVEASLDNQVQGFDFERWKKAVLNDTVSLVPDQYAFVSAGTDMVWQQRRTAKDSLSGHALLFGTNNRSPIWYCLKQKSCKICSLHRKRDDGVPEHNCTINHNGSSKSMEPLAVVDMVTDLYDCFYTRVKYLITDDNSTMKANCWWSNEDYKKHYGTYPTVIDKTGKQRKRKCTGKLRYPVHQPDFLGDPNHRVKTVCNSIKTLQKKNAKDTAGCLEIDTLRISKNFAYFVRTLSMVPEEDWGRCSVSVIDHHFDKHDNCGAFCRRKDETEEERKNSNKFYRDVEKDKPLYDALYTTIGDYLTVERLKEVAHCYDTNANESINNLIAWLAPKNKYLSGTATLRTQIATAIGIQSLGFDNFFRTLFEVMGIDMTDGTEYWLTKADCTQEKKKEKQLSVDAKKKQKKIYYDTLKKKTEQACSDIEKGIGYYRAAVTKADEAEECGEPKQKKQKTSEEKGNVKPCRCGSVTH
jgi:hypothetical protein